MILLAGETLRAALGFGCRAVVADCAYSVSDDWYLALREAGLAYVVALKPHRGTWAPADQSHTPIEAAHALTWKDAKHPGDWTAVERHFRDGHTETWWAADARLGGYGPDSPCRLVVATTDPATLPEKATWYLATNLPHPDALHATIRACRSLTRGFLLGGSLVWHEQVGASTGCAGGQVRGDSAAPR
ncbi:hypothetical protein ACH4UI_34610 [Streptomyces griseochromogenes]|uniref:hypothetical protein n=1 Tax=Streptomyces griseochromogenes TaxID=68214 RepID=UPI0037BA4BD9